MISDITVIILLYKTPEKLLKNFKVLKKFKIILLDQSNDKIVKKKLLKILPNITHYTVRSDNLGFSKGINELIKKVKTKYFFCIQPDVKINAKSIYDLKKTYIKNEKEAAIVVPKISNFTKFNKKKKGSVFLVDKMIGATFFGDKKKFIKLGMFDEDFFFYWEDMELSNRIENSSYKIILNPKVKVSHNNGTSSIPNFKSDFMRTSNFIFGELLFDYKIKKFRIIKPLRKILISIFF